MGGSNRFGFKMDSSKKWVIFSVLQTNLINQVASRVGPTCNISNDLKKKIIYHLVSNAEFNSFAKNGSGQQINTYSIVIKLYKSQH